MKNIGSKIIEGNSVRFLVDSGYITKEELAQIVYEEGDNFIIKELMKQNKLLESIVISFINALNQNITEKDESSNETEKSKSIYKEKSEQDKKFTKLKKYIKQKDSITVTEIQQYLKVSFVKAREYMSMLEDEGIAITNGKTKPHKVVI